MNMAVLITMTMSENTVTGKYASKTIGLQT